MTVPTLPTDNLYKFHAITGITIVLAAVYGFATLYLKFYDTKTEQERRLVDIQLDSDFLTEDIVKNERELDRILEDAESIVFGWTEKHAKPIDLNEYGKRFEALKDADRKKNEQAKAELISRGKDIVAQTEQQRERQRLLKKLSEQNRLGKEESVMLRDLMIGSGSVAMILILYGTGLAKRGFKKWAVIQERLDAVLLADAEEAMAKRLLKQQPDSTPPKAGA